MLKLNMRQGCYENTRQFKCFLIVYGVVNSLLDVSKENRTNQSNLMEDLISVWHQNELLKGNIHSRSRGD